MKRKPPKIIITAVISVTIAQLREATTILIFAILKPNPTPIKSELIH